MAKGAAYTDQQVIDALDMAQGYVSKAASILHCSAQTVYNYKRKSPAVAEAWDDIREKRHDFVENALHKLIEAGNPAAIIFYLKTQAKARGYVERTEFVGAEDAPPIQQIIVNRPSTNGSTRTL